MLAAVRSWLHRPTRTSVRAWRTLVWILPLGVALWLVDANLNLGGQQVAGCTATSCDATVTQLGTPEADVVLGRDRRTGIPYRVFRGEPMSLKVMVPRRARSGRVTVRFDVPEGTARLRARASVGGATVAQATIADTHPLLWQVAQTWHATSDGALTLFRRPDAAVPAYASVDELMRRAERLESVADHHANLAARWPINDYAPLGSSRTLAPPFTGGGTVVVYVGAGEPFHLELGFATTARPTPGSVRLRLAGPDGVLETYELTAADWRGTNARRTGQMVIDAPGLADGLYQVEVDPGTEALAWTELVTTHRYVTFDRRVTLAASGARPTELSVRGSRLTITPTPSSQTVVRINGRAVDLERSTSTTVALEETLATTLTVDGGPVTLEADGEFALAPLHLRPFRSSPFVRLGVEPIPPSVQYVVAHYPRIRRVGRWYEASLDVETAIRAGVVTVTITPDSDALAQRRPVLLRGVRLETRYGRFAWSKFPAALRELRLVRRASTYE